MPKYLFNKQRKLLKHKGLNYTVVIVKICMSFLAEIMTNNLSRKGGREIRGRESKGAQKRATA